MLDAAKCGDYRIMDKIFREFSLQECLKEIDSDCGVNGDTQFELGSITSADIRSSSAAMLDSEDGGMNAPISKASSSGSGSDDKLPVQCGISEKESK